MRDRPRSVVVAGGGPAGAAAAIRLRSHDVPVTLCAAVSRTPMARVGERLGEVGTAPLRSLNVWPQFLAGGHQSSAGVVSLWGSDDPIVADAMNPYAAGWHVSRPRFDAMLLDAAAAAGATVLHSTRVVSVDRSASGTWTIGLDAVVRRDSREADFVVDATGRGGRDLRGRARVANALDKQIGFASVFPVPLRSPYPNWTLIEACPLGWWYSAPQSDGESSVILFSDPDLLPPYSADALDLAAATGACLTADRIPRTRPSAAVRVPAWSGLFELTSDEGCVRIGDAALACDPLCGAGLARALKTGIEAADAIAASFRQNSVALSVYTDGLTAAFRSDLVARQRLYGTERRWLAEPFWRRRASSAQLLE